MGIMPQKYAIWFVAERAQIRWARFNSNSLTGNFVHGVLFRMDFFGFLFFFFLVCGCVFHCLLSAFQCTAFGCQTYLVNVAKNKQLVNENLERHRSCVPCVFEWVTEIFMLVCYDSVSLWRLEWVTGILLAVCCCGYDSVSLWRLEAASRRSDAIMSSTRASKVVFAVQPNIVRALVGSPSSKSTSVKRKY